MAEQHCRRCDQLIRHDERVRAQFEWNYPTLKSKVVFAFDPRTAEYVSDTLEHVMCPRQVTI